jgi:hypothetical protein
VDLFERVGKKNTSKACRNGSADATENIHSRFIQVLVEQIQ